VSLIPTGEEQHFEEMSQVVVLFAQNKKVPEIARETGLKQKDVRDYIKEWKETAVGSDILMERYEELIASSDEHYSTLIEKFYEIVAEVDDTLEADVKSRPAYLAQKNSALRSIADLEAKRLDIYDKAGLRIDASVGDELVDLQEYVEFLESVIDETICDADRIKIQQRISERQKGGAVIVINE